MGALGRAVDCVYRMAVRYSMAGRNSRHLGIFGRGMDALWFGELVMSLELKAAQRRGADRSFTDQYLIGHGLDLAPGNNSLGSLAGTFPRITGIDTAAWPPEALETLGGIADQSYDFVHSSLGLALVPNCFAAISHWFRVLRPNGHLILTLPDEDLAAQGQFPPPWQPEWHWSFALYKRRSWNPQSVNLINLFMTLGEAADIRRLCVIDTGMDFGRGFGDQTGHELVEACIEAVIRKRPPEEIERGGRLPPPIQTT